MALMATPGVGGPFGKCQMKFVALVSGGKDSIFSILECQKLGHVLVGCVHMAKPPEVTEESWMYQTAASEAIQTLVEDCIGVPLILHQRQGLSRNTSLVYEPDEHDEVEDLHHALKRAKENLIDVRAVCSGAILSNYQRVRVESVCERLGLTSLAPLWRQPQHDLLQRMIDADVQAVLVKVASPPGLSAVHLRQSIQELQPLFQRLFDRYHFHVCGEGGEYETLVLDCPLYRKRLVIDDAVVVETDDGVGMLHIQKCHAQAKETMYEAFMEAPTDSYPQPAPPSTEQPNTVLPPRVSYLPGIRRVPGGLWHTSEIMAPCAAQSEDLTEAELAVREARQVFLILDMLLKQHDCTSRDVMMVHLYLSEISHFGAINQYYRDFFGTLLPPSRSCVAVGKNVLPGGRRVLLDCIVQCGSGEYMRAHRQPEGQAARNPYAEAARVSSAGKLRQVLHVQSRSFWAPVCVGPYSQANTYRGCIHFLAGQIGLVPISMTLQDTWEGQLQQAWKNVASVLDCLDGSFECMLSVLLYVSTSIFHSNGALAKIREISTEQLTLNSKYLKMEHLHDGYEDAETMNALAVDRTTAPCPLLVVAIPEMPVGALVEVETMAVTAKSFLSLHLNGVEWKNRAAPSSGNWQGHSWDTGHDFIRSIPERQSTRSIESFAHALGNGSAAVGVSCLTLEGDAPDPKDCSHDLRECVLSLIGALRESVSDSERMDLIHLRLFYICKRDGQIDDGIAVRSALISSLVHEAGGSLPAVTVVPVHGMSLLSRGGDQKLVEFAIQGLLLDPVRLESDYWLAYGSQD